MKVEITESVPRGRFQSIAFLHEAKDPAARAPECVREALAAACRASGFRGRDREVAGARTEKGGWVLVGLGRGPATVPTLRRALRRAVRDAGKHDPDRLLLAFDNGVDARVMRILIREAAQADYQFEQYKSRPRAGSPPVSAVVILPSSVGRKDVERSVREAPAFVESLRWARDLGNTPSNDLGPGDFAREAGVAARRVGVPLRVLDRRQIEKEGMGGVLAVGSGSARPPVFLIGDHRPPRGSRSRGTVVLVGKGITFDSGGISIKPAASMGEMKYDMMGAATVFACLFAAKRIDLPVRVVALAPLAENLPSGTACRPGDILRMRNGKTVEVDNTDAEGRLVLADALSYAENFRPDVIVDVATLTGAVLVALGHECAGLMTPDNDLARDLVEAGEETGERLWRLPVWQDYRANLKSEWADMKNTGGRNAGTINAAVFLQEFVPPGVKWAHLDVAGVAHLEKEHAGYDAGATGFGVALILEFLRTHFSVSPGRGDGKKSPGKGKPQTSSGIGKRRTSSGNGKRKTGNDRKA